MRQRINTGNFENGQEKLSVKSWTLFLKRHWSGTSKSELLSTFGHSQEAVKAIEKLFQPFICGNEVLQNLEDGETQIFICHYDGNVSKSQFLKNLKKL